MTMRILIPLVLAFALMAPANAAAAIRTATIDDPLDSQPSEFDPHYRTDVQHVHVTYDEVGKITVAFRFFQAEPMDALTGYVAIAGDCDAADPYVNFNMTYDPDGITTNGTLYLTGYSDALNFTPTLSSDGRTLTGTVSHAALANRDFRCVDGGYGRGKDYVNDFIADGTWFAGYQPPPPPVPTPGSPGPTEPESTATPTCSDNPDVDLPYCSTAFQRASRKRTYVTVGPYRYGSKLYLKAKPRKFGFWGSSLAESGRFFNVRWSSWMRNRATGKGYGRALHGHLSKCGRLIFDRYKVRFALSRKRLCGDTYEFTRIRFTTRWGRHSLKVPHAC